MNRIEVVYAPKSSKQVLVELLVSPKTTVLDAIIASNIPSHFPEIDLDLQKIGIFGKLVFLHQAVHEGDRIEIYRPLEIDPRQARRLRVKSAFYHRAGKKS